MNLRDEIRRAYDPVKPPEETVERMKQELYQKDFHEDEEELTFIAEEARRPGIRQYFGYFAMTAAVCLVLGGVIWNGMQEKVNDFHPGSNVNIETTVPTEETTEETTETTTAPG
ncbi:MAG: hypothetical protein IJ236_05575 [Oscillospiraceae bacterium]|nr:hypothetical protein [Oscillospiraceae bacterium]MBQ9696382.1 hypothetical protein [Oscillospiraceae bacterium]